MKYREVEKTILELIKESNNIIDAIHKYFSIINTSELSAVINKLSEFDYESDYTMIIDSILSVIKNEIPKIKIKAYWFGIFETGNNICEEYQSYISATDIFTDDDPDDWAVNPQYFPENRFIKSEILIKMHPELNKYEDFIEIRYFALWYFTLVIGIFIKNNYKQFLINTRKCYICVGFDEGDYNIIGLIDSNGLKINSVKIPKPIKLKKTTTKYEYYVIEEERKGAWFLDEIKQIDGKEFVSGFSRICKPISVNFELISAYNEKYDGIPVDYTEETLSGPVISTKIKDIILKYCNEKEVQLLPLTITNYPNEKYYIMNILISKKCLDKKNTIFYAKDYVEKFVLYKNKIKKNSIFRISDNIINNYIFVNSLLKEELERLEVTGLKLTGIDIT